ncbi:hypothetical protein P152DRAFT_4711 [Eremomyces bilateralis CBS 781.70]|uniref:Uncharacterized protein n=1 Tax=Eremomyces bilateralis CBS 781.70 TaxID=1392243 RepID=A0A6G1GG02_9PEZI|nr:uncharacterized protein P152DRAFT_4711 [Eremomyces bilateralis CBS 781.70]KAF1816954.1 hypothetical protein P152DRAFT_4711 [Eremomyces bilateralis CBS 781.70]
MCRFYAHTHPCGHTNMVFAAYCSEAAMVQRQCIGGEIWQTLTMDDACGECVIENAPATQRPARTGKGKKNTKTR